jgi:AmmeMemoRadiSam system protein A
MAPSYYTELTHPERSSLLEVARAALSHGLVSTTPPQPQLEQATPTLRRESAVFVTLTRDGKLRGCIGSIEASAPLLWAVADAAHGAGFRDPRFDALEADELHMIDIEISVLSPLEPLPVTSRAELFATLRPERDGLLLKDGERRATFLPKVWEQLPDRDQFLGQLMRKAGLAEHHWSARLQFFRYQTLTFGEADNPH